MWYLDRVKTTIDLPAPLLSEAKAYAASRGIPLKAVFTLGLEQLLRGRTATKKPFRLKTVVTRGEGSSIEGDWGEIQDRIYEGRGA